MVAVVMLVYLLSRLYWRLDKETKNWQGGEADILGKSCSLHAMVHQTTHDTLLYFVCCDTPVAFSENTRHAGTRSVSSWLLAYNEVRSTSEQEG